MEESPDHVMRIYFEKSGSRDRNENFVNAPPLTYQDSAHYLASQPKWEDNVSRQRERRSMVAPLPVNDDVVGGVAVT